MPVPSNYVSPAQGAFVPTQHDSNNEAQPGRALFVGGAGNVKLTTIAGENVTFTGVLAGSILPVAFQRIWSTGTTATNMVGLY
jgi:hypothetical protein